MSALIRLRHAWRPTPVATVVTAAAYMTPVPVRANAVAPPAAVMVDAGPTYAIAVPAQLVPAAPVYRAAVQEPATPLSPEDEEGLKKLLDLLGDLARLAPLAALVVPFTEIRRVLGGLGAIPLPGGQSISAGRWVSWEAGGAVLGLGYALGYISGPSPEVPFALWLGSRWAMIGILANVIYDKWFAPTPEPAPEPVVVEGRAAARA